MGKKSRGKGKASQALDVAAPNVDRGSLAQALSATSQIAAECNSILRDLLRGRCVIVDYHLNSSTPENVHLITPACAVKIQTPSNY